MGGRRAKSGGRSTKGPTGLEPRVRGDGAFLRLFNSGLEVWLYDEAHREALVASGATDFGSEGCEERFREATRSGRIVGYSLLQDDAVAVEVHVGRKLTKSELSRARWLDPQTALLDLPSGDLRIESNDSCRLGPLEPGDPGGRVAVPPGRYRLTLYRIDREALAREGLDWTGAQEVIVLSPRGRASDAAQDLLPFEPRRDLAWCGAYTVEGRHAAAQVWFDDFWDTFVVNLDAQALSALGARDGAYLRVRVPALDLELVTTLGSTWQAAEKLPRPDGIPLTEYGVCALARMATWNGAEALFARRVRAATCVEERHHGVWLPAEVERLEVQGIPEPLARAAHVLRPARIEEHDPYDGQFLTFVLSDLLPGVDELEELALADALARIGAALAPLGLTRHADVCWTEEKTWGRVDHAARIHFGDGGLALSWTREGAFEFAFLTEFDDTSWQATGLLDELAPLVALRAPAARVRTSEHDEPVADVHAAHLMALEELDLEAQPVPTDERAAVNALGRFLESVRG